MATAGYLISRAAERPAILSLTVAIVGVRFFGLARPLARYLERLASHDLAFRALGRARARVYERIEPLAPAELTGDRQRRPARAPRRPTSTRSRTSTCAGIGPPLVALVGGRGLASACAAASSRPRGSCSRSACSPPASPCPPWPRARPRRGARRGGCARRADGRARRAARAARRSSQSTARADERAAARRAARPELVAARPPRRPRRRRGRRAQARSSPGRRLPGCSRSPSLPTPRARSTGC